MSSEVGGDHGSMIGASGRPNLPVTIGTVDLPAGAAPSDLPRVRSEIEAAVSWRDMVSIGNSFEAVHVALRPGRERIADALIDRYGGHVQVDVSGIPWPPSQGGVAPKGCNAELPATGAVRGLSASVAPDRPTFEVGREVTGKVTVLNDTDAAVAVTWGGSGVAGYLLKPGTARPAAVLSGLQTLQLVVNEVPAGTASAPIPVFAGVASCDPGRGTALQPGDYDLVAVVSLADGGSFSSAPARVRITRP